MEKITLVCTSLNPDHSLINRMLDSAKIFDAIVVHEDKACLEPIPFPINKGFTNLMFVYHPSHLGIGDAYNWIIDNHVNTEWICCFCDDDYFYPEGLKTMINEVHKGIDADIAHFRFRITGHRPLQDIRAWLKGSSYVLGEGKPITPTLLNKHNRLPAGSFFRKEAWKKAGGFQGEKFHDWYLWKRMAQEGCSFKYFDHLLYELCRRKNSAWIRQNESVQRSIG